jgi:hypothetical protein
VRWSGPSTTVARFVSASRHHGRPLNSVVRQHVKIRSLIDPFKAVESDKKPFCRLWGIVFAVLTGIVAFVASDMQSLLLPYAVFAGFFGYGGGLLFGWFMWGLFLEPQIEARKKGQRAV